MTVTFQLYINRSYHSASLNLRVGKRSWNLTITWNFYKRWRITPYFHYHPNMAAIEADWDNRHKDCCGWTLYSHCGRFEGA